MRFTLMLWCVGNGGWAILPLEHTSDCGKGFYSLYINNWLDFTDSISDAFTLATGLAKVKYQEQSANQHVLFSFFSAQSS